MNNYHTKKHLIENIDEVTRKEQTYRKIKTRLFKNLYLIRQSPLAYLFFRAGRMGFLKQTRIKTIFGSKIMLYLADPESFFLLFFKKLPATEDGLTKFLVNTLTTSDVFYDVGANYGFYTKLAEFLDVKGVHSFEPNKKLCITLTSTKGNSTIINEVAVSNVEGMMSFYNPIASGSGKATLKQETLTKELLTEKVTVAATTLDNYSSLHDTPTVIKIDVEGAEADVIQGSLNILRANNISVILEIWGGSKGSKYSMDAVNLLQRESYESYEIMNDGSVEKRSVNPVEITQDHVNFLFIRKNVLTF